MESNKTQQKLEVSYFNHRKQLFFVGTADQLNEYYKNGNTEKLIHFKSYSEAIEYIKKS